MMTHLWLSEAFPVDGTPLFRRSFGYADDARELVARAQAYERRGAAREAMVAYDMALALHRVIYQNVGEHRLERLATQTTDDNRISFGCINVPTKFYAKAISSAVKKSAVVYILPDKKPLEKVFPALYADAYLTAASPSESISE